MEKRFLGHSGLQLSVLGFGAMTFGDGKGRFSGHLFTTWGEEARRLIDICLDEGVNFFDTADVYSDGVSEEILGEALGDRRKGVIIATKAFGKVGPGAHDLGSSRRHLIAACEASLRRLGTDWIDLYQLHNFDSMVPLEETLRALDDLVTAGKVRYIGCSNYAGWQLMKALSVSHERGLERFVGQQIQYSLMVRDGENELLPCGVDQGVGAIIWSPLAQGFLSGKYRAGAGGGAATRLGNSGETQYAGERTDKLLDTLSAIAVTHDGATLSQVALNWLARRPGVTSILVGARDEAQLRDNLRAASWSLSAEEVEALDRASQIPLPYPQSHHFSYGLVRNTPLFPYYI